MDTIFGVPEGRPGIWLIDPATGSALIDAFEGKLVHNLIGHENFVIDGVWEKRAVHDLFRQEGRLALVFPPNPTMKHQLVFIDSERRWAFDIGEISEEKMEVALETVDSEYSWFDS